MARDISSGFRDEIEADVLSPAFMLQADFDSGTVFIWSGQKDIVFNGDTYTGLGHLLGISAIEETQKLQANGVSFSLSGIPSTLVSIALQEDYQGRAITAWFAVLNRETETIIGDYRLFSGQMDVMEISDDGEKSTITIRAESDLIDLREAKERRYTPEDQKIDYPDDKGMDFVPTIQEIEIVWGAT